MPERKLLFQNLDYVSRTINAWFYNWQNRFFLHIHTRQFVLLASTKSPQSGRYFFFQRQTHTKIVVSFFLRGEGKSYFHRRTVTLLEKKNFSPAAMTLCCQEISCRRVCILITQLFVLFIEKKCLDGYFCVCFLKRKLLHFEFFFAMV